MIIMRDGQPIELTAEEAAQIEASRSISLADAKTLAIDVLEKELVERKELATIGGVETKTGSAQAQIVKISLRILGGISTSGILVSMGEHVTLNATKLQAYYQYEQSCENSAITHYQAIQALTTVSDLREYVQTTLKTGWPDPAL